MSCCCSAQSVLRFAFSSWVVEMTASTKPRKFFNRWLEALKESNKVSISWRSFGSSGATFSDEKSDDEEEDDEEEEEEDEEEEEGGETGRAVSRRIEGGSMGREEDEEEEEETDKDDGDEF